MSGEPKQIPTEMTEFDMELNLALHRHKVENEVKTCEVADECGINRDSLYKFVSGKRSLSGENTKRLMDYLNLTVELKPKSHVS